MQGIRDALCRTRAGRSSLPGVNFWAPAFRWLSTITSNTLREPAAIWVRDIARDVDPALVLLELLA